MPDKTIAPQPFVLYFDELEAVDGDFIQSVIFLMPEERQKRAFRLCEAAKTESCAAYALLLFGLSKKYCVPHEKVSFVYGESEKPYLADSDVYFNISHCRSVAVCAFDFFEIGADVQNEQRYSAGVVNKVCTENEKLTINNAADFARLWSMKESIIKRRGTGLADINNISDLSEYNENGVTYQIADGSLTVYGMNGCFVSVCCESGKAQLQRVSFVELSGFISELCKK